MDANELMIGDWVQFDNGKDVNHPNGTGDMSYVQVESIGELAFEGITRFLILRNGKGEYQRTLGALQPIPLTTEILEKNGLWEKDPDRNPNCLIAESNTTEFNDAEGKPHSWVQIQDISSIECSRWYLKIWGKGKLGMSGYIGYVHELQHALRLAGIKKEIVL